MEMYNIHIVIKLQEMTSPLAVIASDLAEESKTHM